MWFGDISKYKESGMPGQIFGKPYPVSLHQCFYLGRESQRAPIITVVERLYAERISRQEELLNLGVPDCESKHASQMVNHGDSEVLVKRKQNLGIAC